MLKRTVFFIAICFVFIRASRIPKNRTYMEESTKYPYPELFRDHIYHKLSKNGKEIFQAIGIHPACVEKKGQCIPRAKCTGQVLYISRICYHRDKVCCYDNSIRFPEVAHNLYQPPVPDNSTRETYVEPAPELP